MLNKRTKFCAAILAGYCVIMLLVLGCSLAAPCITIVVGPTVRWRRAKGLFIEESSATLAASLIVILVRSLSFRWLHQSIAFVVDSDFYCLTYILESISFQNSCTSSYNMTVVAQLLANRTETIWQSRPVQTAIKDSFVWAMGPQRFVTLTSCKLAL